MSNFKNIWIAVCFYIMTFATANKTYAAPDLYIGGSLCKAANLQQALSLGLQTNQFGAKNSGSSPFFVVCPIVFDPNVNPNFINLGVGFPDGGGSISCVARFVNFNNDSIKSVTISINTSLNFAFTGVPISGIVGFVDANASIVCPVQPGQTIRWYGYQT